MTLLPRNGSIQVSLVAQDAKGPVNRSKIILDLGDAVPKAFRFIEQSRALPEKSGNRILETALFRMLIHREIMEQPRSGERDVNMHLRHNAG